MKRILRFSSIQGRLGAVVFSILLLLVVSVGLTFWGLENQKHDASLINLAGRQRMLLEQISGILLSGNGDPGNIDQVRLDEAVSSFTESMNALTAGGLITDYSGKKYLLEGPTNPLILSELTALQEQWSDYQAFVNEAQKNEAGITAEAFIQTINQTTHLLVGQADRVVKAFEQYSAYKNSRLITLQIIFLITGLILLGVGWWMSYRSIILPLQIIGKYTGQIGSGDLSTPIPKNGPDEVIVLGNALDSMRSQLLLSRSELKSWAAQLEYRVEQRTRELEALSQVGLEISSHLDLNAVLQSVTEKALLLIGAEVASLCLLDGSGKTLHLNAVQGFSGAIRGRISPVIGNYAESILQNPTAQACGSESCGNFCAIIQPGYRMSHIAAALRSGNRVIGALCVGSSQPQAFTPEAMTILTQLANAAAGALENSRLYEQAEHAAMLEERQRIASDMHDGLLQTLSFLQWMVRLAKDQLGNGEIEEAVATMGQIERANSQAEGEIRLAVASLQEELPQHTTLQKQLEELANSSSDGKIPIIFIDHVLLPLVLPQQTSEQVLRVVREALMNAQRYSQADQISIRLEYYDSRVTVEVDDDGVGFSPMTNPDDGRPHFGLKIMRARAGRLNGELIVRSTPGSGTQVTLTWPNKIQENLIVRSDL